MATKRDYGLEVDSDDCLKDYQQFFHPDLLKGKVALITGGGSGIGFRIAEVFMRHGCKIAIASRKMDKLEKAANKLIEATNGECFYVQADVRQPKQVVEAVDKVVSHYGKIDILVNNAAGNFLCYLENLSYNAFKTVTEIDTMGTFNVSKAVYDRYFKDHGGVIISISATIHYRGNALQGHAGSAKAAIDALTRHMSIEWGPKGVRVNSIAPGPILGTEGLRRLGGQSKFFEAAKATQPLQRWGTKTEIADSCLYLASDASSYTTGHVLVVDGAQWMVGGNAPLPDIQSKL